MLLILILPNNQEIKSLADRLREEHIRKRDKFKMKITDKLSPDSNLNEGGSNFDEHEKLPLDL